jgi:hypothetical protein
MQRSDAFFNVHSGGMPRVVLPKNHTWKNWSNHTLELSSLGEGHGTSHCSSATLPRLDDFLAQPNPQFYIF